MQNKDILNAIHSEQSAEYQNTIPKATGENDLEVYAALTSLYKETFDQVQAKTGDSIHISASSDVARFRLEYK